MGDVASHDTVIILDFGSQYTQLIARRIRSFGVYCKILPFNAPPEEVLGYSPKGLILSGGPSSVYDEDAPRLQGNYQRDVQFPILGICYGFQLLSAELG